MSVENWTKQVPYKKLQSGLVGTQTATCCQSQNTVKVPCVGLQGRQGTVY